MNETEPEAEELKLLEGIDLGSIVASTDLDVLSRLNLSAVQTPDFVKTVVRKNDSLNIKEMDRIEWAHNVFFEYKS
jgi:hypothetical protein